MSKFLSTIAVVAVAMFGLAIPAANALDCSPAQAVGTPGDGDCDTNDATLTVTVPNSITLTFTDGTEDFGTVLAGAQSTRNDSISYDVVTNNLDGGRVNLGPIVFDDTSGITWKISQTDFSGPPTYTLAPTNGNFVSNWRTFNTAGTRSYSDDYQVTVGTSTVAGNYTLIMSYVAQTV